MINSSDYDRKYMKIKFNSDDELPLNKTIEIPSMIIVVRVVFMKIENNKHYPQSFLRWMFVQVINVKETITIPKNIIFEKKFLYFTCLFINYNCIIDSC